jgi:hypothetical protein
MLYMYTVRYLGVVWLQMGLGLDDWIYWHLTRTTQNYRQYSTMADLHTLQITGVTKSSQPYPGNWFILSHCNCKSHMKSSCPMVSLPVCLGIKYPSVWVSGLCPVSETLCSSVFLEYRTMDKVQKPNSPECHIPWSEPFKVYLPICGLRPDLYYCQTVAGLFMWELSLTRGRVCCF